MEPKSLAGRQALKLLALAVVTPLLCGCATPALWKHTAARNWRPGASPDQCFRITTVGHQDVLVVFHQSASRGGDKSGDRLVGWNLYQLPAELTVGADALRDLTNRCDQVEQIPMYPRDAVPAGVASTSPGYIVYNRWIGFTVHLEGVPPGPFELPVSQEECRATARIIGTPFAVAADAVIIGAIAAAALAGGAGSVNMTSF